jgi:putative glutamine amidotransferase
MVNSLHSQGIDRPAPGLRVEAVAPDGQIEAVSLPEARFVVGVQWHPEYKALDNPLSSALFSAFARACRQPGMGVLPVVRAA